MSCPHCGAREVGRIAHEHFYCWICCVEFARDGETEAWRVFSLDEEGQLLPLDPQISAARTAFAGG